MFKFVTIYRRVEDESTLETFFSEIHLPLAEQLPHLVRSEVSRIIGKPGGSSRFHLMYELYFASKEEYELSMVSEVGVLLVKALKPWDDAKLVSWFYAESYDGEA